MTSLAPVPDTPETPETPGADSAERVRCSGCDFRWYGAIAAHGLSVLGRCPKCGGELQFRSDALAGDRAPTASDAAAQRDARQPWQVLGVPQIAD